jgi:UDP-N-acetylglucosamine diphosphorylase / glucose-1-phosphate thymidylyltransferase / UDP-N-acetylgalactosamine diphosphorylase / glucosamine-1-phosphate N-acetyltransferase / galactosamine-1-phosphate N-acetyltransferase
VLGAVGVEGAGELVDGGREGALGDQVESSGPILLAEGARIAPGARLDGPLVVGPGVSVGAGARVRESVLLPGAAVAEDSLVAGAIVGKRGALA